MLTGWLEKNLLTRVSVVEPAAQALKQQFSAQAQTIDFYAEVRALPTDIAPDLVVLAVKPQQMTELLTTLAARARPHWPIMTIAAGLPRDYYARYLPQNPVIRAMPNTAVMVGCGMTVAAAPPGLDDALRAQVEILLRATGDFFWLDDEAQMDAVTAISGSGGAYFYYFTELLARAGEAEGLTEEQAMRLARQTLVGAGAMAAARPEVNLEQMRREVTSPGGVTEATIKSWETGGALHALIKAGVAANVRRGKELAGR